MERHNVRSVMIHSSSTICGCRFIPNTRCARMRLFFSAHGDVSKAEMAFTYFVRDPAHARETELHLPTFSDLRCWQDWYLSPHRGGHLGHLPHFPPTTVGLVVFYKGALMKIWDSHVVYEVFFKKIFFNLSVVDLQCSATFCLFCKVIQLYIYAHLFFFRFFFFFEVLFPYGSLQSFE